MIRRRRTPLALAALAAVAALAGRAEAASIATYQLKNNAAAGTAPVSQVVAEIQPPGSVFAPASSSASPLTVLSGSGGFNAAGVTVAIGTGKLANGDPLQVLNLQFDKGGLAPGGVVDFSLNLGANYTGPNPTLLLEDPHTGLAPAGLTIAAFTPPTTSTGSGSGSTTPTAGGSTTTPSNNVPEPVSIALWSVAAGLGLLRARAFRRARQVEG